MATPRRRSTRLQALQAIGKTSSIGMDQSPKSRKRAAQDEQTESTVKRPRTVTPPSSSGQSPDEVLSEVSSLSLDPPTESELDSDSDFVSDDSLAPSRPKGRATTKQEPPKWGKVRDDLRVASSTDGTSNGTSSVNGHVLPSAEDLLRPGVSTGLGPGKEVIIKKRKARAAGKVPYKPGTIHPNTHLFLRDLRANNSRAWMKDNDPDYRAGLEDFKSFIEVLNERMPEVDDEVPELPVKDIVFRVHRDTRFSKNKTPYKPYFSAAWSRTGRKGDYAMYFIRVGDDLNMLATGLHNPEAKYLNLVREQIDRDSSTFKQLLGSAAVRKEYFPTAKSTKQAVAAFVEMNAETALKTKPKGYATDHPDKDLLRLRSYTLYKHVSQEDVCNIDRVCEIFAATVPFVQYLNSVALPDHDPADDDVNETDDNGDDGSDEDE